MCVVSTIKKVLCLVDTFFFFFLPTVSPLFFGNIRSPPFFLYFPPHFVPNALPATCQYPANVSHVRPDEKPVDRQLNAYDTSCY